jgi:methyl-accepting chemotaxis protein
MFKLSDVRVSVKLPAIIALIAVGATIGSGLYSYFTAASKLESAAEDTLAALAHSRKDSLQSYLDTIEQDLRIQSNAETVEAAFQELTQAYDSRSDTEALHQAYVRENPYPAGEREKLDRAEGQSRYNALHGRYHPWFRQWLNERGYYDIFLVDTEGDVVYTVYKEADFATNLTDGPWKDTDLAAVAKEAFRCRDDEVAFEDFAPYEPSHGAPASFIATSVYGRDGECLGALIVQMPIDNINDTLQMTAGMGETGETFLVGQDKLMRSDSRFAEESTILEQKVDTPTVRAALEGEAGVRLIEDYRGVEVLSAFVPMRFHGAHWALMAEKDFAEVVQPAVDLRNAVLVGTLVILALAGGLGFAFSRTIAKPISAMTDAMRSLADGKLDVEVPDQGRKDEVGAMGTALQVFKENAIKMRELAEEQEAAREKERQQQEEMARLERERMEKEQERAQAEQEAAEEKARLEREAAERQRQEAEELQHKVDQILEVVDAAAKGDLRGQTGVSGDDAIGQMGEGITKLLEDLRKSMAGIAETSQQLYSSSEELSAVSNQMASASEETSSQASTVSAATEQVTQNMQSVSSASEEMSSSIKEIAQNANDAAQVAKQAVKAAEDSKSSMGELDASSQEIGQVIKLITSIAEQTNLLALNATIEAARAGDAGKGFAVVANEVKELAKQTAEATEEISQKIEGIQSRTSTATESITEVSKIIQQIDDIQQTIAAAVEEQTSTTTEIARNISEASKGGSEIGSAMTSMTQAANDSSQGAQNTLQSSKTLAEMSGELSNLVSRFKV